MARTRKDDSADGVTYIKPNSQLDVERRLSDDYTPASVLQKAVNPTHQVQTEEGFIGVNPEYQNYATDAGKPLNAEEGADKLAEDQAQEIAQQTEPQKTSEAVMKLYRGATLSGSQPATVTPDQTTSADPSATEGLQVEGSGVEDETDDTGDALNL